MQDDFAMRPGQRPIRRRSVMWGALWGSLAIAGSGLVCVANGAEPSRLVGVLEEDPPIINPAVSGTIPNYVVGTSIYDALTHINPDGNILPLLAESWEVAPDGLAYTWHPRHGVTWHDGVAFTAADVKFSIENATARLQAACRGRVRKSNGRFCRPMDLYVIASARSGIADALPTIFPGCVVKTWEPLGREVRSGKLNEAIAALTKAAQGNAEWISRASICGAVGMDAANFRRRVTKKPEWEPAMRRLGLDLQPTRFVIRVAQTGPRPPSAGNLQNEHCRGAPSISRKGGAGRDGRTADRRDLRCRWRPVGVAA